mmetsp:Transcript_31920/g.42145  ORF Transcript_31920/g.42145 Transcript_31920/m.42145 type:complete len:92 (-) Transcript_31920:41-316(-)
MFGDSLLLSECQDLVQSLSRCDLAFQCAHGRPSVIPLLNLNSMDSPEHFRNTRNKSASLSCGIRQKLERLHPSYSEMCSILVDQALEKSEN